MREFKRTDRVGDALQRLLASTIQFEIRDPRVGMININDVQVTRDLAHAKVFITKVGATVEEAEAAAEALNGAAGYLRSIVAKEMNMRTTPRLHFIYDHTAVRGQELSSLISQAVKEDQGRHTDGEQNDEEA